MSKIIQILMISMILLFAVSCGSSGIDNGVSSQTVGSNGQVGDGQGKDPGPEHK